MVVGDDVTAAVDDDAGPLRALGVADGFDGHHGVGDRGGHRGEPARGRLRLSSVSRRDLRGGERFDGLGGLVADPSADEGDDDGDDQQRRQRDPGHLATEEHVADAQLAHGGVDHDGCGLRKCRGAERRRGGGITPRVGGLIRLTAITLGVQCARIGGVALQRFAVAVLTAEGLGEHGIGRLIGRRVVALVACLVGAEERTLESLWSAERTRGCWIDGRSRHRARRQTVAISGLVLIGHPLVHSPLERPPSRRPRSI